MEALKRLPRELPIASVHDGLRTMVLASQERLRHAQLLAALQRSVAMRTRATLHETRSQRLVVTSDTECGVCGRRIGHAAFCWIASTQSFAHMGCTGGAGSGA